MSKKNQSSTPATAPDASPIVVEAEADVVIVDEGAATESAIEVSKSGVGLSADVATTDDGPDAWLAKIPKNSRELFLRTPVLEDGQLSALVDNLPSELAESCKTMLESLNPVREGMLTASTEMVLPAAKIYQGTGDDSARPVTAPPGSVYTSTSELLLCFEKIAAKQNRVGETITVAIIALVEDRAWWKPRRDSFVVPPGVDPASKAPICQSPDRTRGTRYGQCSACPHRPFAKGVPDREGCANSATIYFVVRGFKGIYSMGLKGGSLNTAVAPIRRIKGKLWDRWLDLSLLANTNDSGKWYTVKLQPHGVDEDVQGLPTSAVERDVFKALSATVINGPVKFSYERVYSPREEASPEPVANPAAVLDAATKDYSNSL